MFNYDVIARKHGETAEITVPMSRAYCPLPFWITDLGLISWVLVPCWVVGNLLMRAIFRWPIPPRARIQIDQDNFRMDLCDSDTGERKTLAFPTNTLTEFRKNQFEPGVVVSG